MWFPVWCMICKCFFHSVFSLLIIPFNAQKCLGWYHTFVYNGLFLCGLVLVAEPRNHCQIQCCLFSPQFFSEELLHLTFMSLVHFELILVYGVNGNIHLQSSACGREVSFPAPFVKDAVFPYWMVLAPLTKLVRPIIPRFVSDIFKVLFPWVI